MINVQIRQFKERIISETNASPLPIEVKRLVFVEVMKQLQEVADSVINTELAQSAQESKKEEDSDEQSIQSN